MPGIYFIPAEDAYISQFYPDKNFNGSTALFISQFQQTGDIYRSLIRFKLQNALNSSDFIPPGSSINNAFLILTIIRNEIPIGDTITLNVFRTLSRWHANKVTWNTQPNFSDPPDGEVTIGAGSEVITINLTTLVQDWFNGAARNLGLLLTGDESNNRLVSFASTFYPNSTSWPLLLVEYT